MDARKPELIRSEFGLSALVIHPRRQEETDNVSIAQKTTWLPTAEQTDAMQLIRDRFNARERFTVLAGLAGTGKTALVVHLPDFLGIAYDDVIFMTVANKAAQVLRRKAAGSGFAIRAQTIFSYLNKTPYEWHCTNCPTNDQDERGECHGNRRLRKGGGNCGCKNLYGVERDLEDRDQARLIVCDEASMVSFKDYESLLSGDTPVLFVGDHGQLGAIASGNFNVMSSPDFTLRTILRQAQDSNIIRLAHAMRSGGDFQGSSDMQDVEKWSSPYPEVKWEIFNAETSIVLVPTDRARRKINYQARRALGVDELGLQAGDFVVSHHNDPELGIYNGSLAFVEKVNKAGPKAYNATVRMLDEGRPPFPVWIKRKELDEDMRDVSEGELRRGHFVYAYAMTVHKAQGSEWDNVLVVGEQHWGSKEDKRRWLYTAYTRARKRLVIHA